MSAVLRRAALVALPSLALAGCLMSRLEIAGDSGQGGSGASSNSGGDSGGGGKSSMSGSAGKSMQGGSENGDSGAPDPGGSSSGGTGNAAGDGGTGNTAGDGNMSGSGGSAGSGGSGGTANDPNAVVKSVGCGKAPSLNVGNAKNVIQTSGVKDAGCAATYMDQPKCGPWSTPREFYVQLPADYDPARAYPLVLQTPTCGGTGLQVYALNTVSTEIIRVGLTPAPNALGHGTNPGESCFDDKEGDDSLDFAFYEALRDTLEGDLCIDRNRVFASGNGNYLANELVCKYAGDPVYPIRGVLANTGGLPTSPQHRPTCSDAPFAAMWIHETADMSTPFSDTINAINYALEANGCAASAYGNATFEDYPIGGGQGASTCKKVLDCPDDDYPLVVCALNGNQHTSHDQIANPGFGTLLTELMAP